MQRIALDAKRKIEPAEQRSELGAFSGFGVPVPRLGKGTPSMTAATSDQHPMALVRPRDYVRRDGRATMCAGSPGLSIGWLLGWMVMFVCERM